MIRKINVSVYALVEPETKSVKDSKTIEFILDDTDKTFLYNLANFININNLDQEYFTYEVLSNPYGGEVLNDIQGIINLLFSFDDLDIVIKILKLEMEMENELV